VVLATILQGVGVPPSGVALILGVDRILDMCRTSVNVTGDLTAVTIMDRWLGKSEHEAGETERETGGLSPNAAP
jgi:Na+/H+-dicarboxylate symporter